MAVSFYDSASTFSKEDLDTALKPGREIWLKYLDEDVLIKWQPHLYRCCY